MKQLRLIGLFVAFSAAAASPLFAQVLVPRDVPEHMREAPVQLRLGVYDLGLESLADLLLDAPLRDVTRPGTELTAELTVELISERELLLFYAIRRNGTPYLSIGFGFVFTPGIDVAYLANVAAHNHEANVSDTYSDFSEKLQFFQIVMGFHDHHDE